ncbi:hypothetical protein BWQ96_03298 [Gracilariopsis chorda]|uniref:Uncharacterized protein n=1 Tax=Gracilariopsis chorda TaxID=448386 RepID=A0A2V3J0R6_9FLOR|nr:hypothetical protein BWQ96_03298 [Gracilariopsis chorda]|eukprot:PXF46960.1 hypothetical protein BWQ96_03298 [Gracilariopsis chorda]
MNSQLTFVPQTTFLGAVALPRRASCARSSGVRSATTAVLDTPASNTYLQRHAELAVRDFLTRRAVNTVMYYMHELGDNTTRTWLKRFERFSERVENGQFVDGESYLNRMMRAEKERISVQVSHLGGRLLRTYEYDVEPFRLAKRILDIRKQLAAEWVGDLRCIEMENLEIQRMAIERALCSDEAQLESKRKLIFDSDPFASDQTPLRYKNYHALKTLITSHAVSRLLPYVRDCGSNHDYMYLLQFCRAYGMIGDGDQFVRELMGRPIERRTHPSYTIQPRSLALQVLELRTAVAAEWIEVMKFVPSEHMLMNRRILERSVEMGDGVCEQDEL